MEFPLERVTLWLTQWHGGDHAALEKVTNLLYEDLRRLASHYLRDESPAHTLQATALVHELYLRVSTIRDIEWKDRGHFITFATQTMRRILIDHARKRRAVKRDGSTIGSWEEPSTAPDIDVLVVDQALTRMAAIYPRHAEVVELRFFGGLDAPEVAQALQLSVRTVERDWRFAKAWLQHEISSR